MPDQIDSMDINNLYHNLFNAKYAAVSAVVNGAIATAINSEAGSLEMICAGAAQAASSFLSTGFTARLVQHFSPIKNPLWSYSLGSLIPATTTFVMSYTAHTINGTPYPLASCVAPTVISFTTSHVTNYLTRRGFWLPGNYPSGGITQNTIVKGEIV